MTIQFDRGQFTTEEIEALYEQAKTHLWQNLSNPDAQKRPKIGVKGEGAWTTDIYGKKYFEANSVHSCLNLGYGQQELIEAATEQMKNLAYYTPSSLQVPAIRLATKLSELFQGEYTTFFTSSGSEANEVALKIARQYHIQNGNPGKYKFISHYSGYHGGTLGVHNASATPFYKSDFPGIGSAGFIHVLPPDRYRSPFMDQTQSAEFGTAQYIEGIIQREEPETIAGILVEPVLFAGGCYIPSPEYLQLLSAICKKYDLLLMVDEVVTGFGRTGKWFGYMHSNGVQPDIITTAKGLTSAYVPLASTSVNENIYSTFKRKGNRFRHFSTMGSHPVGCAVALKNIEIMERDRLVDRVSRLSQSILSRLHDLDACDIVGDVRGRGFMYGIEFVENKQTKEPLNSRFMSKISSACEEKGILVAIDEHIIRLNPPLVATEEDLHFLVDALITSVKEVNNGSSSSMR